MKRLFIGLSVVALMIGLVSCGEKQVELTKTIPASNVKITGDCSNFFTVSGDVKIILTKVEDWDFGWEVRAVIPLSKTAEAKPWSELEALPHIEKPGYAGMYGFSGCTVVTKYLDAYGTEVDLYLQTIGVEELLKSGKTTSDDITTQYLESSQKYENCKAKYDKVSGVKIDVNLDFGNYFDEEPSVSKKATSSNNWDALLDVYENYVDQYVKLYKKAMDGDMSAITEYVNLLEKAQKLSDQLDKAKGNMTKAQMDRYLRITNKMANALQ